MVVPACLERNLQTKYMKWTEGARQKLPGFSPFLKWQTDDFQKLQLAYTSDP